MARRLLTAISLCIVMTLLSACGGQSAQGIMDSGMNKFAEGKKVEEYVMKSPEELLDELIDKFSDSYYYPYGSTMSDEEHEKAIRDQKSTGSYSGADNPGGNVSREVSNTTELMRLFQRAYENTETSVEFTTTGGFQFDYTTDLQDVYTQIQREDPICVSGVSAWTTWASVDSYYISIEYYFGIDELKRMKTETKELVEKAANEIDKEGRSDYEIVRAVNDYLCDKVDFPPTEPYAPVTHTAYGALKNGTAVCEGYACAAKLLLSACSVESDIEVGVCLGGGDHAWNLVRVDNDWYQLDITWNDQCYDRSDYFLVTDAYMKQSRTWDASKYPICASAAYMVSY